MRVSCFELLILLVLEFLLSSLPQMWVLHTCQVVVFAMSELTLVHYGDSRIRSSTSERVALTPPQNNPVDLKPRGTTKRSKKYIRVINSGLRV